MSSESLENRLMAEDLKKNYFKLRAVSNLFFDIFYSIEVHGLYPSSGPRLLVAPHQNSLDGIALMRSIDEYLGFVYGIYSRHLNFGVKVLQRWHIGGVRAMRNYVRFKHLFAHWDSNEPVFGFPQGMFQNSIDSFSDGLFKLANLYEQHAGRKVAVVPVGITYSYPAKRPRLAPIPAFRFPFPGTKAVVSFGTERYINGEDVHDFAASTMKEVARLSGL